MNLSDMILISYMHPDQSGKIVLSELQIRFPRQTTSNHCIWKVINKNAFRIGRNEVDQKICKGKDTAFNYKYAYFSRSVHWIFSKFYKYICLIYQMHSTNFQHEYTRTSKFRNSMWEVDWRTSVCKHFSKLKHPIHLKL